MSWRPGQPPLLIISVIFANNPYQRRDDPGFDARERRVPLRLRRLAAADPVALGQWQLLQSNGMAEAFVKTFKRDYVYVQDRPDAKTVLSQLSAWFEDYNESR